MTSKDQYERLLVILKSLKGVELLEEQPEDSPSNYVEQPEELEGLEELDTLLAALLKAPPQGRSYSHQATGPNWDAERDRHPTMHSAWQHGHLAAHVVLSGLKRSGRTLTDESRAHLAHLLHGAAERVHPHRDSEKG